MRKEVRREFDPGNPPPLTAGERAEIEALKRRRTDEVDTGDIAPLSDAFWKNAAKNPYFRPLKQQLTLRLDADVVAWFKENAAGGRGYQRDINAALREHVARKAR